MTAYIQCYKKRNHPRIDTRICRSKCSDQCDAYQKHKAEADRWGPFFAEINEWPFDDAVKIWEAGLNHLEPSTEGGKS